MEKTSKIIRKTIHIFLKNYQFFTLIASLFVLPVSVSVIVSPVVISSTFMATVHARLELLFMAAGYPDTSQFFSFLSIKLSQTICSSIFSLPFTLTFLLLAKSAIIQSLSHHKTSILSIYNALSSTFLCNSFIILSANASTFSLFFLAFNLLDSFGYSPNDFLLFFSATGAVLYSIILAKTFITCNLALIVAGMESSGGFIAVLRSCVLIRGRASTALTLALPVNFGLAALEALFQFRVVKAYRVSDKLTSSIVLEGLLVAYLYSILVVIDTITTCIFYNSCKSGSRLDNEDIYYRIELAEEGNNGTFKNSKILHELP